MGDVIHAAVPADTDPDSFAVLADRWRSMGISERVALIEQLCVDVEHLGRADIAARHPGFTELEICHELTRRRYGEELADAAYENLLTR